VSIPKYCAPRLMLVAERPPDRTASRLVRRIVVLAHITGPSQFAMEESPEAFGMSRGFAGRNAPRQALTPAGNRGRLEHRRLEFGLDLLSIVGNPHGFMKGLLGQPGSPNGLTYMVFNGSH
jgi:hypothetical protein